MIFNAIQYKPSMGGEASFGSAGNLSFRDRDCIKYEYLEHEYFHMFQSAVAGNFTYHTSIENVCATEFEQHLHEDVYKRQGLFSQNKFAGVNLSLTSKVCTQSFSENQITYLNIGLSSSTHLLCGLGANLFTLRADTIKGISIAGIGHLNHYEGYYNGLCIAGMINICLLYTSRCV